MIRFSYYSNTQILIAGLPLGIALCSEIIAWTIFGWSPLEKIDPTILMIFMGVSSLFFLLFLSWTNSLYIGGVTRIGSIDFSKNLELSDTDRLARRAILVVSITCIVVYFVWTMATVASFPNGNLSGKLIYSAIISVLVGVIVLYILLILTFILSGFSVRPYRG